MSKRKAIPKSTLPSMDSLLGGQQEDETIAIEENVRKEEKVQIPKSERPKAQSDEKVKVAFYIDAELAQRFEFSQVKLKALTGKKGHEVSRSKIIETALSVLLDDLDKKERDSLLAKNI